MAIEVISNLKPKNNGNFPVVEAEDVWLADGDTLQTFIDNLNITQGNINAGEGLKFDKETNTLSVDTANIPEEDNTKPITSAGVYTTIGNINALLESI